MDAENGFVTEKKELRNLKHPEGGKMKFRSGVECHMISEPLLVVYFLNSALLDEWHWFKMLRQLRNWL